MQVRGLAPGTGATVQRPPRFQASVLWLQPANRTAAGATTWSEDSPGQSVLVERMPTTGTPDRPERMRVIRYWATDGTTCWRSSMPIS